MRLFDFAFKIPGDRYKDFEIRTLIPLRKVDEDYYKYNFELIKWYSDKKGNRYCHNVGLIKWDFKERNFRFESLGSRYFICREDGLEEWLDAWCELKADELWRNRRD